MAIEIDKIQLLYGKSSDWERINPILLLGEPAVVLSDSGSIPMFIKIGNGTLPYNQLPIIGSGEDDISFEDIYTRAQIDEFFATVNASIESSNSNITGLDRDITAIELDLANTKEQVATNLQNIADISNKMDSTASGSNKLLSRSSVEEIIDARYIYAQSNSTVQFETFQALVSGPWFYGSTQLALSELRNGDTAIVVGERYKFDKNRSWVYNGRALPRTSEAEAAISSGINSQVLQKIQSDIISNTEDIATMGATVEYNGAQLATIASSIDSSASTENKLTSASMVASMISLAGASGGAALTEAQLDAVNSGITSVILGNIQSTLGIKANEVIGLYHYTATVVAGGTGYKKFSKITINLGSEQLLGFVTEITPTGTVQEVKLLPVSSNLSVDSSQLSIVSATVGAGARATLAKSAVTEYTLETLSKYYASQLLEFIQDADFSNAVSDDYLYVIKHGLPTRLYKSSGISYVDKGFTGVEEGNILAPFKTITTAINSLAPISLSKIEIIGGSYAESITLNNQTGKTLAGQSKDANSVEIGTINITGTSENTTLANMVVGNLATSVSTDRYIFINNIKISLSVSLLSGIIYVKDSKFATNMTIGAEVYLDNCNFEGCVLTINPGGKVVARNCQGGFVQVSAGATYIQFDSTLRAVTGSNYALSANSSATFIGLYSGEALVASGNTPAPISIPSGPSVALGKFIYDSANSTMLATRVSSDGLNDSQIITGLSTIAGAPLSDSYLKTSLIAISSAIDTLISSVSAKYTKPGSGIPKSDLESAVQTTLNNSESVGNKVTSATSESTDTQYPTAKALYDQAVAPIAVIAGKLAPTGDMASKDYVSTAIVNSIGRTITPTAVQTGEPTDFWESFTELTTAVSYYYQGEEVTELQLNDEASYWGSGDDSELLFRAKYDGSAWLVFSILNSAIALDGKQDLLSGTGILELSTTPGEYTERAIVSTISDDESTDIPTEGAVVEALKDYQPIIEKTLSEKVVVTGTVDNGVIGTRDIATTIVDAESTALPTEGAVKIALGGYQTKIDNSASVGSPQIVVTTDVDGIVNVRDMVSTVGTNAESLNIPTEGAVVSKLANYVENSKIKETIESGATNDSGVPTIGAVKTKLTEYQPKIVKLADDVLMGAANSTVGSKKLVTAVTDETSTLAIPSVLATEGRYQKKISARAGSADQILTNSSVAGTLGAKDIATDLEEEGADASIPTVLAVKEAISSATGKEIVLTDSIITNGNTVTLESNTKYRYSGSATDNSIKAFLADFIETRYYNIIMSSTFQPGNGGFRDSSGLVGIPESAMYFKCAENIVSKTIENSTMNFYLPSGKSITSPIFKSSNITVHAHQQASEQTFLDTLTIVDSTVTIITDSTVASTNYGLSRVTALKDSRINAYGYTQLIFIASAAGEARTGEVHLYGNSKVSGTTSNKNIIVYLHSTAASVSEADRGNFTIIDLSGNTEYTGNNKSYSAEILRTERTISLSGAATGSVSFDGSANVDITVANLAPTALSGAVAVDKGGTGRSTLTANAILAGNTTGMVNMLTTAAGALCADAANGVAAFKTVPIASGGTGSSTGDTKYCKVSFTEDAGTDNVATGETHATLLGKIKKWFSRLKALAFKDKTVAGDYTAGSIVDADISATAAIAASKISGLGTLASKSEIVNADVSATAAIAASKISGLGGLSLKDTVTASDIDGDSSKVGYLLQSLDSSTTKWVNPETIHVNGATRATHLNSGSAGKIPYQTGPGATGFTNVGLNGQVLISQGEDAPVWQSQDGLSVGYATNAGNGITAVYYEFTPGTDTSIALTHPSGKTAANILGLTFSNSDNAGFDLHGSGLMSKHGSGTPNYMRCFMEFYDDSLTHAIIHYKIAVAGASLIQAGISDGSSICTVTGSLCVYYR